MSLKVRQRISYLAGALALTLGPAVAASASEGAMGQTQARLTDAGSAVLVSLQPSTPQTYGTTSTTAHTVPAYAFAASDDSTQSNTGYNRFSPTGAEVEAPLFLPKGALITSIELEGCDTDAAGQVVFVLGSIASNGNATPLSGLGTTGGAAVPGCGFFPLALATPHTVDNTNTYTVAVRSSTTNATSYTAVRVYYNLQVSPAPGVATFDDVPTGDFAFQFVEAFNAAGITVGCNAVPLQFCPDRNVTRREMAVFFAKALGLHFVP
jgi:hypothetical protein